ncbi:MAG: 3-mercaptopyruvate sulfurtransferase [Granulosicoccaceae bacterium]
MVQNIVTTDYLASALQQDSQSIRLFDATFHLIDKTRDAQQECGDEHISGAQFFDITRIADTSSPLPNTVPSATTFEQSVRALGVNSDHTVVAYDRYGLMSAARVWWLFRYFGHDNVVVLDGGLPKWLAERRPVDGDSVQYAQGNFTAELKPQLLSSVSQVHDIVNGNGPTIVDARGAGRFAGNSPEPREGLRAGHIPGSVNLPYSELLNSDHTFKRADEITAAFKDAGVNPNEPIVASCGSGVTACILALGLAQLGEQQTAVFDGSWTEWGSTQRLPIATM